MRGRDPPVHTLHPQQWIYGGRLRLSNVAVLVAFAIAAELGGVGGALLAMPIAATYPTIEKLWLRDQLSDDVVAEHEAVKRRSGG